MDSTRILLVDDDDETRELLREFFDDRGYAVETAADGAMALSCLSSFAADLVITDLEMPGMSGLELIRSLHAENPTCPVLLVTARAERELPLRRLGRRAGFECLRKPLDLEALGMVVERMTAAHALQNVGRSHSAERDLS
ncbi:MAG TPA: response regulator [Polyangia bacterium]|jgi:DNA-binding response OmpR family regulator|nr:response regulator [Polyangia bacterium]